MQPCSPRIQRIPLPRPWNWTNCGRVCSKKRTTPGCGWPCAARHVKWSPLRLRDRSKKTCQRLWAAYQAVIPEEQHTAVGKETGETCHVEHWNNTRVNVWLV